jgi:YggT family protein
MGLLSLNVIRLLVVAGYVVLIGRVLMSWANPRFDTPVGRFLFQTTEPLLRPIRSALPRTGPLDLAPLAAFLALSLIAAAVGLR